MLYFVDRYTPAYIQDSDKKRKYNHSMQKVTYVWHQTEKQK